MLFRRSTPPRYADYTRYRPYLRTDFRHRCAYCLTHEGHNGGEGNFCIDHHRPVNGPFGRSDLEAVYTNLYWACRECNENKSETWPTPEQEASGARFIDPCRTEDDHDNHWRTLPDENLQPITAAGAYTIVELVLWRPQLGSTTECGESR